MTKDQDTNIVTMEETPKVQKLSDLLAKQTAPSLAAFATIITSSMAKMFPLMPVVDTVKEEAKRVRHEMRDRGEALAAAELQAFIDMLEDRKIVNGDEERNQ